MSKSTLVNALKGENISITGDSPNLTRDAVKHFTKTIFISNLLIRAGFSKSKNQEKKNFNQIFTEQTKKKYDCLG